MRLVPIAMTGVLGVSWALPLVWLAWVATLAALAGLAVLGLLAPARTFRSGTSAGVRRPAAAACALAIVGLIDLGYAAFALTHANAFGPLARLGYPLLVATGLRLSGGLWMLLLCLLVSVIPLLFADEALTGRNARTG